MAADAEKKRKEGWFEALFSIEVLAIDEATTKNALAKHLDTMRASPGLFIAETKFYDIAEVSAPFKDVEKAYSQVVAVTLFARDFTTLLNAVMAFGPSAVELLGPAKKDLPLGEAQTIANQIAGLVHQFAAAGIGGMVLTGTKK